MEEQDRAAGCTPISITLAMVADWGIHAALVVWRYHSGKWKTFEVI